MLIYIGVLNCSYMPNLITRQILYAIMKTTIGYQRVVNEEAEVTDLVVLNVMSSLLAESIFHV